VARFVLRVFADERDSAEGRNHQKHCARDLEPKLVQRAAERADRGAHSAHNSVERAAAPGLLAGNPRHHSQLLPSRNFAHGLDFNSLQSYNDATAGSGEPFHR